jgi:Mrp family chromosome partitioning ATPase
MLTEERKRRLEAEDRAIIDNIKSIKHKIVVLSGKGGVGKSTVSVNLAYALQSKGYNTGLLDADVTGPNVPKMLGLDHGLQAEEGKLIPLVSDGVRVISLAVMIEANQPILWRGPMRSKLLHQFLSGVVWGNLDYLIADLPPGTGDEVITILQKMQPDLTIVVTTPQDVSLIDSRRAISMAKELAVGRIGVIENMSGLTCPTCGNRIDLFGRGGGKRQAAEMNVPFLGTLPIDINARKTADAGRPVVLAHSKSEISRAIMSIAEKIENSLTRTAS